MLRHAPWKPLDAQIGTLFAGSLHQRSDVGRYQSKFCACAGPVPNAMPRAQQDTGPQEKIASDLAGTSAEIAGDVFARYVKYSKPRAGQDAWPLIVTRRHPTASRDEPKPPGDRWLAQRAVVVAEAGIQPSSCGSVIDS